MRSREQKGVLAAILDATIRYADIAIPHLTDRDVAEAADALAATYETSARGIIYDHQAASLSAQRLLSAYREVLDARAPHQRPGSFDRTATLVLRRLSEAVQNFAAREETTETAFLDWLRWFTPPHGAAPSTLLIEPGSTPLTAGSEPSSSASDETPRIIVP
ncbi:MAG: hypothetical protein GEU99_08120 [Luteitalea sp.]|nr:hypothetical protein [Luteitalea sp.]